jgi:RNA 3'-terminal phosphate cyclase-like protein
MYPLPHTDNLLLLLLTLHPSISQPDPDYEASFLRLLDKLSHGCAVKINETGTALKYKPGLYVGGLGLDHDCPVSRSVGYFLEPLLMLAPFSKDGLGITLRGVTNEEKDMSPDVMRTVTLPTLKRFGIENSLELKLKKRGAPPRGGGEVVLTCGVCKQLKPIELIDAGKIRRVRGVAYATRVSAQMTVRMGDVARGVLNDFAHDVFIYNDHYKGRDAGLSAGYALSLVAQSSSGSILCAERTAKDGDRPEELARQACSLLMEEIAGGGCIDSTHQALVFMFMALGSEDISKVRTGKLAPHGIQMLRLLKDFFGITFKIAPDTKDGTVLITCMGVGYQNMARRTI